MKAVAAYLGVVVRDLERSVEWYADEFGIEVGKRGPGWACLEFPNGTVVELFAGDPACPALADASYGTSSGTPILPGYGVEEPLVAATGFQIARRFPDWVVVVTADGLHVVLSRHEVGDGHGLVGFRYTSDDPPAQRAFLSRIGSDDPVDDGLPHGIVPLVVSDRCERVVDPDGNVLDVSTHD